MQTRPITTYFFKSSKKSSPKALCNYIVNIGLLPFYIVLKTRNRDLADKFK